MEHKNVFAVQIALVALLCILLASCSTVPGVTRSPSPGTLPPALPSVSPTQVHTPLNPTGTPVPVRQITAMTSTQTRNSATATPPPSSTPTATVEAPPTPTPARREVTPAPTLTPTPTLSAGKAKSLILDLLRDNGACRLPCFWGLPPTASANMVRSFIAHLGNIILEDFQSRKIGDNSEFILISQGHSSVSIGIERYLSGGSLEQSIIDFESYQEPESQPEDGRIAYGDPYFRWMLHYYLLPQILSNYGKPDQVLLAPILYDAPWLVDDDIDLVLLYQDEGFLVEYILLKHEEGEDFSGCPSEIGFILIVTQAPKQDLSLADFVKHKSLGITDLDLDIDYYLPIEEATSLTIDEFYETFKVPNNPCLKIPRTLWEL